MEMNGYGRPASTVVAEDTNGAQENGVASSNRRKNLHGRAFYESIGSPKFILAPMVDQSEFAWRMLTRSFLPSTSTKDLLAYTPMLHARMFTETPKFRDAHFQPLRNPLTSLHPVPHNPSTSPETVFLDGNPATDRPLFVQFCANEPDELLAAAKYVQPFCDAVDLNLGCPQGIARKGKYGAFLQEDQELIFRLVRELHNELDVPVTAKIRILETKEKTLEYAKNVLEAGASILTVHGRTREMKGHKTGLADWSVIKFLRENLPKDTVMFANGNVLRREDIDKCIEETGVDGVMSAEGNLYDPAIFAEDPDVGGEGREFWRGRDGKGGWRMDAVFRRYMDIIYKYVLETPAPNRAPLWLPSDPEPVVTKGTEEISSIKKTNSVGNTNGVTPTNGTGLGKSNNNSKRLRDDDSQKGQPKKRQRGNKEKPSSPNLLAMQPHLFKLLRPLVAKHHNVRDALARSRAGDMAAFEHVLTLTEEVVKTGMQQYEITNGESWTKEMEEDERLKVKKEEKKDGEGEGEGEGEMDESSVETVRLCKRPWWVVQPYVRPLPKEALAKGSLTLSRKERKAMGLPVDGEGGHVEVEKVAGKEEEIEIPKEGLVCG